MKYDIMMQMQQDIMNRLSFIESELTKLRKLHEANHVDFNSNILSLPKHLQITLIALSTHSKTFNRGPTAEDVSIFTGKSRAVESAYLNQLVRLGYAIKHRIGRSTCFMVRGKI